MLWIMFKKWEIQGITVEVGSPVISQISLTKKIRFLGIPKEDVKDKESVQSLAKRPGFRIAEIKAGAYGDNQVNTESVYTLGVTVGIGTHKDMPEDVIYKMTKTFWEQLANQFDDAPWLRNISIDAVLVDLNMPLHPGAERYYREVGVSKMTSN